MRFQLAALSVHNCRAHWIFTLSDGNQCSLSAMKLLHLVRKVRAFAVVPLNRAGSATFRDPPCSAWADPNVIIVVDVSHSLRWANALSRRVRTSYRYEVRLAVLITIFILLVKVLSEVGMAVI